jgi:hypothetical protein
MKPTNHVAQENLLWTLDHVPALVAQARRAFGTNDVAVFFFIRDNGTGRGLGRPRAKVLATMAEVYPEHVDCIALLNEAQPNPLIVPCVAVTPEGNTVAWTQSLKGERDVGVLS